MSSIILKKRTGSIKLKQRSGSIKLKERTGRIELDPPNFDEKLLKQGLVAYYPFDGDVKDHSGNGNHGTIYGDPQFVEGQGLSFDGDNDYVKIPSIELKNKSFSVVSRIYPFKKGQQSFLGISDSFDHDRSLVLRIYDNRNFRFGYYGDDLNVYNVVNFEAWNDVVCTYNFQQDTSKVYFDKNKVGSGDQGPFIGSSPHVLIGSWTESREHFKGIIDKLRIYNRALSDLEIQKLYELKV